MINLLPPDIKAEYGYARRNSHLVHLVTVLLLGLVGLAAIAAAGFIYLHQSANAYSKQAEIAKQALVEQKQSEVEKQAAEISDNLKLAVQVLSQEVLFSQLLKQLAVVVPSNVSLTGVTISELKGALDITARTRDYDAGTQLQVNLADPANKIFSKADIVAITCDGADASDSSSARYPCSVSIRAQFSPDNPFLFINNKGGTQ